MSATELPSPGETTTWGADPLVVAARVEVPGDAERVLDRLRVEHPATAFLTVLTVPTLDDLGPVLDALAPVMAERLFTSSGYGSAPDASTLSLAALEQHGVGQDFVFQAPTVPDAVSLGLRVLAPGAPREWDGTALLVVGDGEVLRQGLETVSAGNPPATS